MSMEWADVRVGDRWVSRDKRDDGKTVTVIDVGHEYIQVRGFNRSLIRKDNFHKLYRKAAA